MQAIVTRQGINHLATPESEGETWAETRCGRDVEIQRVTAVEPPVAKMLVQCPDCFE